ncbi:MAG: ATP-binding protein, partial [Nitrososphaerales archaeon]
MSLTRVIVELNGQAQSMPWNSSKSALNPNHPVFVSLRAFLIGVVKEFASLSRRLEGNWQEAVLKYDSGPILDQEIYDFPATARSYLP